MIPVYQTKFGGSDDPIEEQGNCFQAALASVLEIPLEEAFDPIRESTEDRWYFDFIKWLEKYNLSIIYIQSSPDKPVPVTTYEGYHIAFTKSVSLPNPSDGHCVVMKDGEFVHDPNPRNTRYGEEEGFLIFVPKDVSKMVK